MAISSTQVSGLVAGQNAMFGNMSSYAHQIGGGVGMPSYANPIQSQGIGNAMTPMTMQGADQYNMGMAAAPQIMSGVGNWAANVLPIAGMGLSMFGGAGGRAIGGLLDPFSGAFSGGMAGIRAGSAAGHGLLGMGARGIAGAMMGAAPALAIGGAMQYGIGQMHQGASFARDTSAWLQNAFRQSNPMSETGYGFSQTGQGQISDMFMQMGRNDVMTTAGELRSIAARGAQMGVFRGVQDAREFKEKFLQMKDTLKTIAETFNTTLSEALPFLQQAKQSGFFTPQDIMRNAGMARGMQAATGMSAAQSQQFMAVGAQMARGIGASGQQGAAMMARAQGLTGAALFGGVIGDRELGEAGFGIGAQGAQNFGQMLAGMTTRFSASRVGRWALASMMGEDGNLDQNRLNEMTRGGLTIGEISSRARRNVSGSRAYDFVMNEENLRGQLAEQGPQAMLGIVQSLTRNSLYGGSSRDRLVTNRLIQRFMGGSKKQAEMVAKMARELPRLQELEAAKVQGSLDAQEVQREREMNDAMEHMKRQMGQWWEKNVSGPLQDAGAKMSRGMSETFRRARDRLFGTGGRSIGLSSTAVTSLADAAMTGDYSRITEGFGSQRLRQSIYDSGLTQGGGPSAALVEQRLLSGAVGKQEAQLAGYSDALSLSRAATGTAAKAVQSFMRESDTALQLRGQYGKSMSRGQTMELARKYVQAIRSGEAGGAAQKEFAGLGDQEAIMRLAALQGDEGSTYTGLSEFGRARIGENTRAVNVERMQEDARDNLAAATGTDEMGGYTPLSFQERMAAASRTKGADSESVKELEETGPGAVAFRLFAEAEVAETPQEKEKLLARARSAMGQAARTKGLSEGAIQLATKLNRKEVDSSVLKAAGQVGRGMVAEQSVAFSDKVNRRMRRIRKALGSKGRAAIDTMLKDDRLRDSFNKVLYTSGNVGPEERLANIQEFVTRAASNPEEASRLMSYLQEQGLGSTDLGLAVSGALRTAQDVERYSVSSEQEDALAGGRGGRGGLRRGEASVRATLGRMGFDTMGKLSSKDVQALIRGGEGAAGAREKLKGLIGGRMGEEKFGELVNEIRGGFTAEEMRGRSTAAVQASNLRSLSEKASRDAGLSDDAVRLTGQEGTMAEIGKQIKLQTTIQRGMLQVLEHKSDFKTGLISEPKKGSDHEGK